MSAVIGEELNRGCVFDNVVRAVRPGMKCGWLCGRTRYVALPLAWSMLIACASSVVAQASPSVDLADPVYRDIEKLVAFDMVDEVLFASQPFTRMDVARILLQAERTASDEGAYLGAGPRGGSLRGSHENPVTAILNRWTPVFASELNRLGAEQTAGGAKPSLAGSSEARWANANSPARGIRYNGLGQIDADINPLLQNRSGRHLVDGNTLSVEGSLALTLSSHLALAANPRVQLGLTRGDDPNLNELVFQRLNATVVLANIRLVFGREQEFWGQGRNAGVLLSKNIRGLDLIKLENDRLFRLPWIFRHLGPTKLSAFIADLGSDQTYPHAKLVGYRISLLPWRTFEIGGGMLAQTGGEGSPEASTIDYLKDLFPFVENIFGRTYHVGSNKEAGLSARWRFPSARGFSVYFDGAIEDIDFDKGWTMFWQEAGYVFGATMPRLAADGSVGIGAEFHHTGVRMYRHHRQTVGFTQNRFIIGNSLGPDANAAHVFLDVDMTDNDLVRLEGAFESRKIDTIDLQHPDYVRVEIFPTETRYRLVGSWQHWHSNRKLSLGLNAGIERVANFDFQEGTNRSNSLAEVYLRFTP